ncbi:MAG: helix-turn-helix domain-containing protein [Fusicatenibacter sp.]|nr:AraC family transcriptional regulator [Fusicatenibacter sp.]
MGENPVVWMAYPIEEQIQITSMYSLFETHFEGGYAFHGETHNFWECLYVVEGKVCVAGDERVYNLSRGSIVFHKPMEFHKFSVDGESGADLLIFSFAAEGPLTAFLRNKVFVLSEYQKQILDNLRFYMADCAKNQEAPKEEHQYLTLFSSLPTYAQMVSTYLQQLMLSLAEQGVPSVASSAPDAVCFGKAISYLNCNIHRQPTIAEIARFCNISEAGIKRIFEKYAGIGVHKYLTKLKMKTASELLLDGESVSCVAARLGFSDQSYFSRAYKRETGRMPSSVKG